MIPKIRLEFEDGQVYEPRYIAEADMIVEIRALDYDLPQSRVQELANIALEIYLKNDYLRVTYDIAYAVFEHQDVLTFNNFWDFYDSIVERAFELDN